MGRRRKAQKADRFGNLMFHSTARNFNPDCAKVPDVDEASYTLICMCVHGLVQNLVWYSLK